MLAVTVVASVPDSDNGKKLSLVLDYPQVRALKPDSHTSHYYM